MDRPLRVYSPQMSLNRENPYGGGVYDAMILRALADGGARLLIPLIFHLDHETHPGWTVRTIPIRRGFKLGALLTNVAFFLRAFADWYIRRERWDLFRISDAYYVGPAGILFAWLTNTPTLCHIHHVDEPFRPHGRRERVIGWVARHADRVAAVSRFSAEQVRTLLGVPPERIVVSYQGIPANPACPLDTAAAKEASGLAGAEVCVFTGSLIPRKNLIVLLEAFALIRRGRPRAALVLIGSAPPGGEAYRVELERAARRLGIADAVRFTGFVDPATKSRLLRAADVFVFPSRLEGFGLALVEAMDIGLPCVAFPRGAIPEVIEDGRTGLLVDPPSAGNLAAGIERLLADPALRTRLGEAARRDVRERFSWDRCAADLRRAVESLVAERAAPRLGVLLNAGDSLARMAAEGQTGRFVGDYLARYATAFDETLVFSYAAESDRPLPRCRFVPGKPRIPGLLYGVLLPFLHARALRSCTVLRVMQTWGALPAVLARVLFGVPYVVTYGFDLAANLRIQKGGAYPWIGRAIRRLGLAGAHTVIVPTPSLADAARRWAPPERIELVPNGVDLRRFLASDRPPLSPSRETRCLFVGRLTRERDVSVLLRALARVALPVSLTVAGDGPDREALRALAAGLDVEANFLGAVPNERMPDVFRDADLFVLPTRGEGHPKALLEAFAAGLPCIGTEVAGVRDVIDAGENGLLCGPDEASLAAAIAQLIARPAEAAAMGRRARAKAEARYDLDRLLDRELAILRRAAGLS